MVQPLDLSMCFDHKPLDMKEEDKVADIAAPSIIIDNVLKALDKTAPKFAKEIGVSYQRVFDLRSGRVKSIAPDVIAKICTAYPQINKSYLYTGEGDLINSTYSSEQSEFPSSSTMNMYSKMLTLFEQIQSRDKSLSEKSAYLFQKESQLNEREQKLNEREFFLNKRELELSKMALEIEKEI